MPTFIPVVDPEKAKSEQNLNDLVKHRKWENPHSLKPVVNRGFEQGTNISELLIYS